MTKPRKQRVSDTEGERVRRQRLRADGQRPPAVNLRETISLSRKLFELRDAAERSRAMKHAAGRPRDLVDLDDLDAAQPDT